MSNVDAVLAHTPCVATVVSLPAAASVSATQLPRFFHCTATSTRLDLLTAAIQRTVSLRKVWRQWRMGWNHGGEGAGRLTGAIGEIGLIME